MLFAEAGERKGGEVIFSVVGVTAAHEVRDAINRGVVNQMRGVSAILTPLFNFGAVMVSTAVKAKSVQAEDV